MDLNLFENLKKDIESNVAIKNFMEEISKFLKDITSSQILNQSDNKKEIETGTLTETTHTETNLVLTTNPNRKEGHLYFVTEDRNNEIYLWDFTDKPNHEFKETISSEELLSVAKEGAMLQYRNGKYELYSTDGYEMVFNEENN